MTKESKQLIDALENDKFPRDIWIRWIKRNEIPSKEQVNDVLEMLQESYSTIYPQLKNIKIEDILEDKVMIHHTLYSFYNKEPLAAETENNVIDLLIEKDTALSMIELLKIVSNQFYVGRNTVYIESRAKVISNGGIQ